MWSFCFVFIANYFRSQQCFQQFSRVGIPDETLALLNEGFTYRPKIHVWAVRIHSQLICIVCLSNGAFWYGHRLGTFPSHF